MNWAEICVTSNLITLLTREFEITFFYFVITPLTQMVAIYCGFHMSSKLTSHTLTINRTIWKLRLKKIRILSFAELSEAITVSHKIIHHKIMINPRDMLVCFVPTLSPSFNKGAKTYKLTLFKSHWKLQENFSDRCINYFRAIRRKLKSILGIV